ncbi:MAG: UDP-N-acetylmuramoyl-L-alanine--D-glutamate ligase [Candidatus Cloacimonetes bacterium]|nr:UDP-N-acetylmuramoyl-L-alanine--D-glutamate ligase [Candidatus Cloacimonadota bacterium]
MEIKGLKFGILGMARSGVATALKVLEYGGSLFISDIKSEKECRDDILIRYNEEVWNKLIPYAEFGQNSDKILDCDLLIVSPGISTEHKIIEKAIQKNIKIISEVEFGFLIKDRSSKIIAVTGSNGKSTTVSLIHHILQSAGLKSILAGNIGNPMSAFPIDKPGIDYLVLELSSFQLELIDIFLADTAVFLNISPDHLDRHKSIEEYILTKMRIFKNQRIEHKAVLNAEDKRIMSNIDAIASKKSFFATDKVHIPEINEETAYMKGQEIIWEGREKDSQLINTSNIPLLGIHNKMNVMAAILAVSNELKDINIINRSLQTFLPLPHRLEKIGEIKGIEFINDSKATNTDSVKYALTAFDKPIHLIAGGYEKGEDYSVLVPYLKENVKRIYLIGNTKQKMQLAFLSLKKRISTHMTMIDAVLAAYKDATKGEVILLSPACASFDMYKNFEHRGDVFRTIVKELIKNEK